MSLALPPLHRWPKPIKRLMLFTGAVLCIGIYVLLLAGVIGLLAVLFDFVSISF
jgi:hypothetical protein